MVVPRPQSGGKGSGMAVVSRRIFRTVPILVLHNTTHWNWRVTSYGSFEVRLRGSLMVHSIILVDSKIR